MSRLILSRHRWTLLAERDASDIEASVTNGVDRLKGGYRHAASAQTIYLEPGSLAQAQTIRGALTAIGKAFPSAQDAADAFRKVRAQTPNYEFSSTGKIWRIANTTAENFGTPFGRRDMRLFVETGEAPGSIPVLADKLLASLGLFEKLAGGAAVDLIATYAAERGVEGLVRDLLVNGMVELDESVSEVETGLPDLLFLGHSSFAVRSRGAMVVFDPVILPANLAAGGVDRPLPEIIRSAAAIIISHHHWDHLHFQTLAQLPRDIPVVVPHATRPSFANPPIARYLRSLGFREIREQAAGDQIEVEGVTIRFFPFFGESFGLGSHFDALTYHVSFGGRTLYGSVDACFDEAGSMEETISAVAELGSLDFFLFGSSGQRHSHPFSAASPRHFSNELEDKRHLLRYHPTVDDVARWTKVLKPKFLIPYATFEFGGQRLADLRISAQDEVGGKRMSLKSEDLLRLATQVRPAILALSPLQGIRFT